MKVLIACEESQTVCKAFRARGHEAYSCDLKECSGNRAFDTSKYGKKAENRWLERVKAAVFFMRFVAADCDRIAIENPIGVMSTVYRKPDQIINPWQYALSAEIEKGEM